MPRIFRARPAPPVGRSINIGVTMRPVAPRPAPVAAAVNAGVAGFGDAPISHFIADDGTNTYFAVDFFGAPIGSINAFSVVDAGTGVPVSLSYTLPTNCCAIMAFASFTGTAYVDIECILADGTTLTALGVEVEN